jgi:hypothetical protein
MTPVAACALLVAGGDDLTMIVGFEKTASLQVLISSIPNIGPTLSKFLFINIDMEVAAGVSDRASHWLADLVVDGGFVGRWVV